MPHDPSRDSSGTVGHRGSGSSDGVTIEENPRTKEMMQEEGQEMEVTRTFHEAFVILQEDVNSFLEALERFETALIEDLEERKRRITSGINGLKEHITEAAQMELRTWQETNEETMLRLSRLREKSERLQAFKTQWDNMDGPQCDTITIAQGHDQTMHE